MLEKSVPYYIQITRILRREIMENRYPPATRMPDEKTLAERFGVSKDVIRVSMRALADENLVKPIRSKGTFVCERPGGKGGRVMILSYHGALHFEAIKNGVEQGIGERKLDLMFSSTSSNDLTAEKKILDHLKLNELSAVVAAPVTSLDGRDLDNAASYQAIVKSGVPLLLVDHWIDSVNTDLVAFDEYGSTKELCVRGIEAFGNSPPVLFLPRNPYLQNRISLARIRAFDDILNEVSPGRIHAIDIQTSSDQLEAAASEMYEKFCLNAPEAKVFFFLNTTMAWAFYQKMREEGRAKQIEHLVATGDILRGDAEFNEKLFSNYRLFDGFTPAIREILDRRLSGDAPVGHHYKKLLPFTFMNYGEAQHYFNACLARLVR